MTVAYDAVSNTTAVSVPAGLSWTHTPVGTPTAVVVWLSSEGTNDPATACTYGGTSMTQITSVSSNGGNQNMVCFGLASPPAGAQTVLGTFANTSTEFAGVAITVTGGNTTTATTTSGTQVAAGPAISVPITVPSGELGAGCSYTYNASGETLVVNDAATQRVSAAASPSGYYCASTRPGAISSMAYTLTSSANNIVGIAVSFGNATGGPASYPLRSDNYF
jgi:hypothetical protein